MMFRNQNGMTMVEVMVAAGLLGGLAVAGMTLFKNQGKAQQNIEQNYDVSGIVRDIGGLLADATNCATTLSGKAPNTPSSSASSLVNNLTRVVVGVNTAVYPVKAMLPGTKITIDYYGLENTFTNLASDETMLVVHFKKTAAAITQDSTRFIKIRYTLSGANISTCYAVTGSASELWKISTVDPNDIFYQTGDVGIGTANPVAKLDIRGTTAQSNIISSANYAPAGANATDLWGINASTSYISAAAGNRMLGGHFAAYNQSSGSLNELIGAVGASLNTGSGTVNTNTGLIGYSKNNSSGTMNLGRGGLFYVSKPAGTINWGYGVFIDTVQATNKWSLYANDATAPSYFAGNVGIGTTNPLTPLEVLGPNTSQYVANFANASTDTAISLSNTNGGNQWRILSSGVGSGDPVGSFALQNTTTNVTPIVALNDARVGINTVTPTERLDVAGGFRVKGPAMGPFTAGGMHIGWDSAANISYLISGNASGSHMTFHTVDGGVQTEKMRITNLGRIGMGTTNPRASLEINGGVLAKAGQPFNDAANLGYSFEDNGDTGMFMTNYTNAATGDLNLFTNAVARMTVVSNGNVGIGEINPLVALHITRVGGLILRLQGARTWDIANDDAPDSFQIRNRTNGTYPFKISGADNVGIGFNSGVPSYLLDVNGTTRATSYIYASDKRLKHNITTYKNGLGQVLKLRGVSFTWNQNDKKDVGFVAQEVEKIEPRLVETDKEGMKAVKYGNIVAMVVEAIKDLHQMIQELISDQDQLEQKMEKLLKENMELKARLDRQDAAIAEMRKNPKK